MKSCLNKTIDFSLDSSLSEEYLSKVIIDNKDDNKKYSLDEITNKTINGDTFSILEKLPKKSVDLLILDPPYNLDKDYHGNSFKRTCDERYGYYINNILLYSLPLLKENASIYVCCDWKTSYVIANQFSSHNLYIQNRITWQREKGRGAKSNWKNSMEDIWFCTMSKHYTFNIDKVMMRRKVLAPYKENGEAKDWFETEDGKFRDTYPSNFWDDISIPYWSMPENTAHPTQKPEKLIAKLILASSNENDLIFDPFLGSGTTSVVAKKLNRNYCGIEQNKLYCAWTEHRLKLAETNKDIQGYTNNIFWERNTLYNQNKQNKKKEV